MALLQSQSLLGIGCSSIVSARARVQQCLAAASHSHAPLLRANGGRTGLPSSPSSSSSSFFKASNATGFSRRRRRRDLSVVADAATAGAAKVTPASSGGVSISDVLWPSAGAFLAMAVLGKMDQMVAFKGVSLTIAPLGAVCCVLFSAPNSPAAKDEMATLGTSDERRSYIILFFLRKAFGMMIDTGKLALEFSNKGQGLLMKNTAPSYSNKYNMFVAQIGCAALGVLALSLFGPGWLARGAALSASIAFMTITGASHPPAASLPLLFIDGPKFHSLQLWYALFPGAAGCIVLCLIQEVVLYLKKNFKF